MNAADALSLAPALLALYAGYSAWRAQPKWLMRRRRHKAMKVLGIPKRATRDRVRQIISGDPRTAADELNWLATAHPRSPEGLAYGRANPMPLTFAAPGPALIRISEAYAAYAADLRRGSFLGTTTVPVVEHDAAMAVETAALVAAAASGGGSEVARDRTHIRLESSHLKRSLDLWQLPDVDNGTLAYDIFVSYRRHRILPKFGDSTAASSLVAESMETSDLETEILSTSSAEALALEQKFTAPRTFDSVLPRLISWRPERDNASGRLRLHLAMAETTYAAVITDHYPETFEGSATSILGHPRRVEGNDAKLLTLSTVLITVDRMLLFASRSKNAGSHQNRFGPAVNGNLELRARHGIHLDSDKTGIPDPKRALAREAHEELGLKLDPDDIQIIGMGQFSVPTERGTHVLLSMARLDMTGEEVSAGIRNADPLEGGWEFGGELLAAPLPYDASGVEPLLSWLLHNPQLTPHAVLTGIAATARHFPVTHEQLQRLAAAPRDPRYIACRIPGQI